MVVCDVQGHIDQLNFCHSNSTKRYLRVPAFWKGEKTAQGVKGDLTETTKVCHQHLKPTM